MTNRLTEELLRRVPTDVLAGSLRRRRAALAIARRLILATPVAEQREPRAVEFRRETDGAEADILMIERELERRGTLV